MREFRFDIPRGRRRDGSEQLGCFGRVFLTGFLAVFGAFGIFFLVIMGKFAHTILQSHKWKATECTIVTSEVESRSRDEDPYVLKVKYTYTINGEAYSSEDYSTQEKSGSDCAKIERLAQRYEPGTKATCYVNPANPSEAILKHESLWFLAFAFIPLIFVAIGVGGIYFTWRGAGKKEGKEKAITESVAEAFAPSSSRAFSWVFFAVFLVLGAVLSYFFFVRPWYRMLDARKWVETSCTVISSRVTSHSDSDGTTYGVDILYSYEFGGREYKSNVYDFVGGSSSGHAGKKAIVDRYPAGAEATCYVNPRKPDQAVLYRGFRPIMLLGLIPVAFFAAGFAGLTYQVRHPARRKAAPARPTWLPETPAVVAAGARAPGAGPAAAGGPVTLKPSAPPVAKLIAALFFAAFWNGILSVFVADMVRGWRSGNPDWFLTLFLIPFELVGLGTIGAVIYCALALFNPRPTLRVSAASVPLGGSLDIEWQLTGNTRALKRLRVYLEGREEATYRRGTSTCTDKETFATIDIVDTTQFYEMSRGSASARIPVDTMHSFGASHNKIIWSLHVHGDIPRWPDVKEEFPIVVLPMQHSQG